MLALTLEKLASAAASATSKAALSPIDVHIYVDQVEESRLREVEIARDLYFPEAFLFRASPHPPAISGTWNILNALKDGARWAEEVYLVEDDVWVYPDFFHWHTAQTSDISCGRRMWRYPDYQWYTNPGSRFSRRALNAIIPHVNEDYFRDVESYCERNFSTQFTSCLDDGLIRRVIEEEGLTVSFPEKAKAAHVGIPMLGRLDIYQISGTSFEDRIQSVRTILTQPKDPARYAPLWEPYEV